MLRPGDVFDRYVVEAPLGEGGMGAVYRALDTRLNRRVALKIVHFGEAADHEARARLIREARAAATLNHPNAIGVYDVGEHEGVPFIAMELVTGRTLRSYVGDASIPIEQRLRWLVEVARALDAAHSAGLVHRDVKPDNVMIGSENGAVKVLDFGIARSIRGEVDVHAKTAAGVLPTITSAGVAIGTPLYMPPEQLRAGEVDARADQFAWGVMAYELLCGVTPWSEARDVLALTAAIVTEAAPPLRSRDAAVEARVEAVVMRALEKAPADRWPSMRSLIDALQRSGEADERRGEPSARPAPGHRSGVFALVAVGVVAMLAMFATRSPSRPEPHTAAASGVPSSAPSDGAALQGWKLIIDHPAPLSGNAEAIAAFSSGLRSARDANWSAARGAFARAATLDPAMAEAAAYVAIYSAFGDATSAQLRAHYERALNLRDKLLERDRRFLLAFQPMAMADPPDVVECAKRLVELTSSYPNDAELHHFAGHLESLRGDDASALVLVTRAASLDPSYGDALQSQGVLLARAGRTAEALAAFDRCTEASAGSPDCLGERARLLEGSGDCEAAEAVTRKALARAPKNAGLLALRASMLVALGRSAEAIDEALRATWDAVEEPTRAAVKAMDEARLAVIAGNFTRAHDLSLEAERAGALDKSASGHAWPLLLALEIDHEVGRDEEAAAHAESYLSRRETWAPMTSLEPIPAMLHAQLRAGKLTLAKHDELRNAFFVQRRGDSGIAWALTFAPAALTSRAQAEAALAALPASGLPKEFPFWLVRVDVATIYLGAGRHAEAATRLRAHARSCTLFRDPMRYVRAHLLLGQALEGSNDSAGACAAYRAVVARWSAPIPRSVSVEQAKARISALSCPKS